MSAPTCGLCGEPMPPGEEMFKFHGYSGPCPKTPLPKPPPSGAERIAAERERQVSAEGWTPEHDDTHVSGEMAEAAASYVLAGSVGVNRRALAEDLWPWELAWFKPTNRVRDLVKAGALIAAEIDRLQRRRS